MTEQKVKIQEQAARIDNLETQWKDAWHDKGIIQGIQYVYTSNKSSIDTYVGFNKFLLHLRGLTISFCLTILSKIHNVV